jgi:hypothetical protein
MVTLHRDFSSDEMVRYGAECRRLGRLSRNRQKSVNRLPPNQTPQTEIADWLSQIWNPSRKLAARAASR